LIKNKNNSILSYEGEKDKGLFQGFGKTLYRGGHTYEGEFNQGMMSGKGKYVWANGISYEGDFLNNEITGNGTYRWPRFAKRIIILVFCNYL
jgi:hypothetical protein